MTDFGSPAPVPEPSPALGLLIRPIVGVTLLTVGTYVANLLTRVAMARLFGTGPELDAFFAAFALPQYVMAVLLGVLPQVSVPVIVMTAHRFGVEASRSVAQGIANVVLTGIAVLTILCSIFSSALLHLTAPGLDPAIHVAATRMAWVLWPSVFASAGVSIAAGIENAENRFLRAALIPLIGAALNLVLLVVLVRPLGALGIAVATTAAMVLQMLLFGRTLTRGGLGLRRLAALPGVHEALSLLWPLLASGVFVRVTIVAERYFGSRLPNGSISEIAYASGMFGTLAMLLSVGIGTVLFPRMARSAASGDMEGLGTSLSLVIRAMWVLIAPAILVGISLARSVVGALFEGGRFSASDGGHVASLLQIYLLAVAGGALGIVTGRVLYSLKAAHLLSIGGTIEAVAYVLYTALLVRSLGAAGVAWGFVIYVTASISWHLLAISRKIRWREFPATAWSAARTTFAALAAAGAARLVASRLDTPWTQLLAAGVAATIVFAILLAIVNRPDLRLMMSAMQELRPGRKY